MDAKTKKLFFTSVDLFNNQKTTIFFHSGEKIGTIELVGAGTYNVEPEGRNATHVVGIDAAIMHLINLHAHKAPVTKAPVAAQPTLF